MSELRRKAQAEVAVLETLDEQYGLYCQEAEKAIKAGAPTSALTDFFEWILEHQEEILAFIMAIIAFF